MAMCRMVIQIDRIKSYAFNVCFFITFTAFWCSRNSKSFIFFLICSALISPCHIRMLSPDTDTHSKAHSHAIHSKMFFGLPLHWQAAFEFRNNESISWFANITFMPMLFAHIETYYERAHRHIHTHAWAQIGEQRERAKKTYSVLIETEIKKKRRTSSCTCEFCTYALKAYAFCISFSSLRVCLFSSA